MNNETDNTCPEHVEPTTHENEKVVGFDQDDRVIINVAGTVHQSYDDGYTIVKFDGADTHSIIPTKLLDELMDSNIYKHAERELKIAGIDSSDVYGDMLYKAVLELIRVFVQQGHSGYSAAWTVSLFQKLASWEALSPLSNNPEEWMDVDGGTLWQNIRQSSCFSHDGGKTYYDQNKPQRDEAGQIVRNEDGRIVYEVVTAEDHLKPKSDEDTPS